MSISTKISVLNQTVEQLQEIVPDLFTKVILNLESISMMESISYSNMTQLKELATQLTLISQTYKNVQQTQLQSFMMQQIYHEEQKSNAEQMDEYESTFENFNENLKGKQTILLEKKGIKPNKKNQALMSQLQIKFQNDIKLSNIQICKFQKSLDEHHANLNKYEKQLNRYRLQMKRKVNKIQGSVFNKSQSYKRYLQNQISILSNFQPILQQNHETIQLIQSKESKKHLNNQQQKRLSTDLLSMLKQIKQQNNKLMSTLSEQIQYTNFLQKQHSDLCHQLSLDKNQYQNTRIKQNKMSLLQNLKLQNLTPIQSWQVQSV